jgi:hypothetical protein
MRALDPEVFSADGTRVAFQSTANDLGPKDTVMCRRLGGIPPGHYYYAESCTDVYVRDLTRGKTTLASTRADSRDAGNADSQWPAFAPVGDRLAFQSRASDLVAVDTKVSRTTSSPSRGRPAVAAHRSGGNIEDGVKPGVTAAENAELRAAKRRIRLLEQENEVLRRFAARVSQAQLPGK